MKVVVVYNNQEVVDSIRFLLQLRWPHTTVIPAAEGSKGLDLVETETPDLVILDVSHGLDLIAQIREFSYVPLVILTDRESEMERVRALEMGADEYVTKPLSSIDFLAKVRALLRRADGAWFDKDQLPLVSGDLIINFPAREVFLSGNPLKLTPIEYNLLCHLARNEGRVLTHRALLQKAWEREDFDDVSSVKKYIYRLRQKLDDDPRNPRILVTVHGVGYKFIRPT